MTTLTLAHAPRRTLLTDLAPMAAMAAVVPMAHLPVRLLLALIAGALLLLAWAPPAFALDRRNGDVITVPAGQTVDDDLMATGRLVRVDGIVRGDLIAFGRSVVVAGMVEGDVIAMAEEVLIEGRVLGDVRAAGATVQVNGSVERNVSGAAQSLRLGTGGRVGGSWLGAGETMSIAGDVGGALAGAGETVMLQGRVNRGAELALESITFGPNASIGGNLDYHADRELQVPASAVRGQVRFHPAERRDNVDRAQMSRFFRAMGSFFSFMWLAGSAVVGLVLIRAFPRFVARFLDSLERAPVANFVVGVVALVATLPLAFLLGITIVGIPAAALLTGGYAAGLFTGWLLLAAAVGGILVGLVRRGGTRHLSWAFLLGLLVLHIGTQLPYLGPLVGFVTLSLGFGTLLTALYRAWQRAEMAPPAGAVPAPAIPPVPVV